MNGNVLLSKKTKHHIDFALKTAYSTAVCLIISNSWQFAGMYTFIGPALSIMSSSLYFGLWLSTCWKYIFSTIIGGVLGICIGYTYNQPAAFVFLFFIALAWINATTIWDDVAKKIGGIAIVLAALTPILTTGQVIIGTIPLPNDLL